MAKRQTGQDKADDSGKKIPAGYKLFNWLNWPRKKAVVVPMFVRDPQQDKPLTTIQPEVPKSAEPVSTEKSQYELEKEARLAAMKTYDPFAVIKERKEAPPLIYNKTPISLTENEIYSYLGQIVCPRTIESKAVKKRNDKREKIEALVEQRIQDPKERRDYKIKREKKIAQRRKDTDLTHIDKLVKHFLKNKESVEKFEALPQAVKDKKMTAVAQFNALSPQEQAQLKAKHKAPARIPQLLDPSNPVTVITEALKISYRSYVRSPHHGYDGLALQRKCSWRGNDTQITNQEQEQALLRIKFFGINLLEHKKADKVALQKIEKDDDPETKQAKRAFNARHMFRDRPEWVTKKQYANKPTVFERYKVAKDKDYIEFGKMCMEQLSDRMAEPDFERTQAEYGDDQLPDDATPVKLPVLSL